MEAVARDSCKQWTVSYDRQFILEGRMKLKISPVEQNDLDPMSPYQKFPRLLDQGQLYPDPPS